MKGKIIKIGVVIVVVAAFVVARGCRVRATGAAEQPYDIVIRNAHIIDGALVRRRHRHPRRTHRGDRPPRQSLRAEND